MPLTTGSFGNLIQHSLKMIYGLSYKELPKEYPEYVDVEDSDSAYEESQEIVTFGLVPAHDQGGNLALDQAQQGFRTRHVHEDRSLGFEVTQQLLRDDKTRQIRTLPQSLSFSVNATVETICANLLNRAFNASFLGSDGVVLASTAHPTASGNRANRPTNAVDMSLAGLQSCYSTLAASRDSRGKLMSLTPTKAVVPPSLYSAAYRTFKSPEDPTTANRAVNPFHKWMDWMVCHYLTSNTAWFVKTNNPKGGVRWFWRVKPEFFEENARSRLVRCFMVHFAGVGGFDDWRAIWATP